MKYCFIHIETSGRDLRFSDIVFLGLYSYIDANLVYSKFEMYSTNEMNIRAQLKHGLSKEWLQQFTKFSEGDALNVVNILNDQEAIYVFGQSTFALEMLSYKCSKDLDYLKDKFFDLSLVENNFKGKILQEIVGNDIYSRRFINRSIYKLIFERLMKRYGDKFNMEIVDQSGHLNNDLVFCKGPYRGLHLDDVVYEYPNYVSWLLKGKVLRDYPKTIELIERNII